MTNPFDTTNDGNDSYVGFWITRTDIRTGETSAVMDEATGSVMLFRDEVRYEDPNDPRAAYPRANTYIREVLPSGYTYQVNRGVVKPMPHIG